MKGFGQPHYWLQIVYKADDVPDDWRALSSGSLRKARDRAALTVQNPAVDYVLILRGDVQRGAVVEHDQIIDEFQAYDVPGAKRYQLSSKAKPLKFAR
jgi:hypothetical protein